MKIRLTKKFQFNAAHFLEGYEGKCSELHGHTYTLYVTVVGEPNTNRQSPTFGMVMDFVELKDIVNREVVSRLDHSLIVKDSGTGGELADFLSAKFDRIVRVGYQPTSENMILDFVERIAAALPPCAVLNSVRLEESPSSSAEWVAADQKQ